jgi:hypothetical protein
MEHFSNQIETDQGLLNFYFNQESKSLYYVSVVDKNRKSHIFNMGKISYTWAVKTDEDCCAEWIQQLEDLLSQEIIAYEHSKN